MVLYGRCAPPDWLDKNVVFCGMWSPSDLLAGCGGVAMREEGREATATSFWR